MNIPIIEIPLELIEVGDRLRRVDTDYARLIAESFAATGQLTPIEVREAAPDGRHRLIAGAHRLAAARLAGMAKIRAVVFRGDQLQAELREIDENLVRRELSELDRATFLAKRKEVYLRLHPETGHGRASPKRKPDNSVRLFPAFAEDVARKLGVSRKTIDRAVRRYTGLAADVRERIATTRLADKASELDALAALSQDEQRTVVEALLREQEPAPSVAAALREIHGAREAEPDRTDREFQRLLSAWKGAGRKARRLFIDHLVANGAINGSKAA